MTWFAMLEGADTDRGERKTGRCFSEKNPILIAAHGSTAGRGLSLPDATTLAGAA